MSLELTAQLDVCRLGHLDCIFGIVGNVSEVLLQMST